MAKKGGKRGSSAARSAAAKKGWETRRKGGAKSKPSTPSKPKAPPKTTTARGRARTAETRARAAVKAGGGTRATRSLLTAQRARDYYKATGTGTKRSKVRSYGPANGIRRTGVLPKPIPANGIRRTTGPRRAPMAARSNAIRAYSPVTPKGQMDHGIRGMVRGARKVNEQMPRIKGIKKQAGDIMTSIARASARNIADSSRKDVIGEVARIMRRSEPGSIQRAAYDVIRRRAGRAAAAAARGSKPAARALSIYDRQLAPVLSGKPGKKASNNIKPGPRNANPPKKKPRKPRTPKPKPPGTPKPKRKPRKPKG